MSKNRKKIKRYIGELLARAAAGVRVLGVLGLGVTIFFLMIAMVSLQMNHMIMGPFGRSAAGLFYGIAGVCGYPLIAIGAVAASPACCSIAIRSCRR